MSILSLGYLIFTFFGLFVYYIIPQKLKNKWLTIQSCIFIVTCSPCGLLFVISTSFIVFIAAKVLPKSKRAKQILLVTIVSNLFVLFVLKYLAPFFSINSQIFISKYLYPVGVAYYTLQLISYLMDVYWGRIEPEKEYYKLLLFTAYYPQLVQGPITKYSEFNNELQKERAFDWKSLKYGIQLMIWGFFKKMLIADKFAAPVNKVFYNENTCTGVSIWIALFCYTIQLYCDFSGGIDIIRGISQCYGIRLKQNFRQPYFARSLGDFWRRWHISLGEWMKDYVFFPLSTSKMMARLKKKIKNRHGRKAATRVTIAISNVFVFGLVGLWHGAGSNYIAWGLYNGIILGLSVLLEDHFVLARSELHIATDGKVWGLFCVIRTFLIVMLGNIFDCVSSFSDAIRLMPRMFCFEYFFVSKVHVSGIALVMCLVLLAVDLLHEYNYSIRDWLSRRKYWVQVLFWTAIIQVIACFGKYFGVGEFLYANF